MKGLLFCIALTVAPIALFGQMERHDTEGAVRQALAQANGGMYTSTVQKELERLGDASAVALTKIIGGKPLDEREVEAVLLILTLSYSDPHIVEIASDREPRTTLFLLHSLDLSTADPKLREKINAARSYVRDQYAQLVKADGTPPKSR